MNFFNSIHNFKNNISDASASAIPFWENPDTNISYTTYTNAPSNYVNAGTGLTGSNQAVIYDYSVVATNNYENNSNDDSKEFRQIGNFWTIVLMNNVGWYPQVWTTNEVNNSYSQDSTAPCILVSFYKIQWNVISNIYFTSQTAAWLRSFDLSSNFHLIYDPNDDGNAPTDSSNNVYHWYDLRISNIGGSNLVGVIDTLVQDISFTTKASLNSTVNTDTNVNLRNLPFGTIAPNDPNVNDGKNRIATTTGGVTDVYDRSPSDPNDGDNGYITIYNNFEEYSIVVTRYTNESLPQILKTRLFS